MALGANCTQGFEKLTEPIFFVSSVRN